MESEAHTPIYLLASHIINGLGAKPLILARYDSMEKGATSLIDRCLRGLAKLNGNHSKIASDAAAELNRKIEEMRTRLTALVECKSLHMETYEMLRELKDDLVLASNVAAMAMQLSGGGYEIMYDEFLEAREKVERMIAAFEEKREVLSEQITLVHALFTKPLHLHDKDLEEMS